MDLFSQIHLNINYLQNIIVDKNKIRSKLYLLLIVRENTVADERLASLPYSRKVEGSNVKRLLGLCYFSKSEISELYLCCFIFCWFQGLRVPNPAMMELSVC